MKRAQQQPADLELSSLEELRKRSNLTRNQLGFWLGQQAAPSSPVYNIGKLYKLGQNIDPSLFQAAFDALLERCDPMRTTFHERDGIPFQQVAERIDYTVPVVDLSDYDDPNQAAKEWSDARVSRALDITRFCFDTALLRLGESRWAWYVCMHHAVCDGASMALILDCTGRFYRLAQQGSLNEAEDLPQFSRYREKEAAYRASSSCERDAEFWKRRLTNAAEPAEYYGNRPKSESHKFTRIILPLSYMEVDALIAADSASSGTAATRDFDRLVAYLAVLAAFQLRTAGSRTLTVGIPFHNRSSADKKKTIGLLMEVAPLRMEVDPEDTFEDLLRQGRSEFQSMLRHYKYGSLNPRRSTYELLLNLVAPDCTEFGGVPAESDWVHSREQNETVTFHIQLLPEQQGDLFYFDLNSESFPGPYAGRATEHFFRLIRSFAADPSQKVGDVDIHTPAERRIMQPATSASLLPGETILSRFEALAADRPESCAVEDGVSTLSYAELHDRSDRLAGYLRARDIGPGTLVGVCMERSAHMVVALLGILKSGAAYLPLDPAFPRERLDFMLQDSAAATVITDSISHSVLPSQSCEPIHIDRDWDKISAGSEAGRSAAEPSNLAYVIYTSGSTGLPKGVQVTHHNVVNFLRSMARQPGLAASDRLLAVTTLSFDISVLELFLPLSVGATTVIASHSAAADPAQLSRIIAAQRITAMQATPATWRMLLNSGWQGAPGLKVLCGGEALPDDLAAAMVGLVGEFWNMYGPTETTVWSTCCRIEDVNDPVSIGKPIDNTTLLILDERKRAVPQGVPGELYIGGEGVARGYLDRPELTAERFVTIEGSRYYRTGDVVRLREDGNVEYRNRADNQVKLHGHRIELGEIESALRTHPAIRDAAVIVFEFAAADRRLAAYYVPIADQPSPAVNELREHLRQSLPAYMLPQHFTELAELPRTPNNKLDRKRLPPPAQREARTTRAPGNDMERRLLQVWQTLLKSDQVSVDDNFFDIGGNSVLSVQLAAQLHKELSREVPLVTIYECPTIEKLARHLGDADSESANLHAAARLRASRRSAATRRASLAKSTGHE